MKKYGKYEKRPEKVAVKQPKVKNVLLQTYFTSLLCLVLCVSMFLGTSYAWFTSEVTNTQNEIYVGTLKVGLYKGETNLANSDKKLFDNTIRWEPGYTALETIKVVNEGDLAFKYVLNFTDGSIADGGTQSIETVAKYFDIWVYDHRANENKTGAVSNPTSYAQITEEGSGWENAGSLDQLLSGESVLDGVMVTVRKENQETTAINKGTTDGVATVDTYTIALHMKEDADSSVMGHKIGLNVKLIAYQMASEKDDFGNQNYDQMVTTAEELKTALANGGTVALVTDIDLKDTQITVPAGVTVTLDLNGHTISQEKAQTAVYAMISNKGTLTIQDSVGSGKITYADTTTYSADVSYASNTIRNEGVLNVLGGTIENTSSDNVKEFGYPHAIDVYQGSVTNIYGGTVKSANYDCIRIFCNSTTAAATVNINGGNIVNRVTFQNPSSDKAGYGVLNITGGTFTTTNGVTANVRLLNFSTDCDNMKAEISGGTFDKGVKTQNKVSGVTVNQSDWLKVAEGMTVATVD